MGWGGVGGGGDGSEEMASVLDEQHMCAELLTPLL